MFTMKNKLNTRGDVSCPRTAEVITCRRVSVKLQLQEQRETSGAKDIKVAPVFLRTKQKQAEKKSVQLVGKGEQLFSSRVSHLTERKRSHRGHHVSHREHHLSHRGQHLSPSALHICVEEVQTSNQTFPVQTVFSTLQKKAGERLQDDASTSEMQQQSVVAIAAVVVVVVVMTMLCLSLPFQSRKLPESKLPAEWLKREEETTKWKL